MSKFLLPLVLASSLFAGCARDEGPATSAVDAETAWEIAETALNGLNEGDYEAWTAHWSDEMKAAVDEAAFAEVREVVFDASGRFETLDGQVLEDGDQRGYVRWTFDATFEKEPVEVGFGFEVDGTQVEGVFLASEALGGW